MEFLICSGVIACDCRVLNDSQMEVGLLVIGLDSLLGTVVKMNETTSGQYFYLRMPSSYPTIGTVILEIVKDAAL